MTAQEIIKELHNEVYEVMANNVDLNDDDLIKSKSVIIDRLQNALVLINKLEQIGVK